MPSASPQPPVPPVSARSQPRFRSRDRRDELAAAFRGQGADYDRLRPGYPAAAIDAILAELSDGAAVPRGPLAVDLGAGTGKLARVLAARGLDVIAVDPSETMLQAAASGIAAAASPAPDPLPGSIRPVIATAEATGLPTACADLVTAAQAWHWFDTAAASAEAARLLRPGGVLALIWNTMDVQIPWVHRFSRIMHAGDVQRDDFSPPITGDFALTRREVIRWEDPMPTQDLIDLARTRSYVITATEPTRAKVLANLDWYLHEHLGHARGAVIGLPYRTDLFLYRPAG